MSKRKTQCKAISVWVEGSNLKGNCHPENINLFNSPEDVIDFWLANGAGTAPNDKWDPEKMLALGKKDRKMNALVKEPGTKGKFYDDRVAIEKALVF